MTKVEDLMTTTRTELLIKELAGEVELKKSRLDDDLARKTQVLLWFEENAPSLMRELDTIQVIGNIHIHINLPLEISALRKARRLLGAEWRFSHTWFLNGKYTEDGHNGYARSYFYRGTSPFNSLVNLLMKDTIDGNASHRIVQKVSESSPVFDLVPHEEITTKTPD